MARSIVVAFHMSPLGMTPGPEGTYLSRARSLCVRGEALGGLLVAWGTSLLAMGWDTDSIEEAVLFAASIREEALSIERAWATGMAEGDLESLSPTGQGILAWGPGLISAAVLARLASPGEVLVDDEVRSSSGGQLSLVGSREGAREGAREGIDMAEAVRGWRLDLDHPWKPQAQPQSQPRPAPAARERTAGEPLPAGDPRPTGDGPLAARIRKLAHGADGTGVLDALADLRRTRARAEGAPARCQASIALAMMLSVAGRADEALLESLDALARAQETRDPKAVGACMALLAKLYAGAGLSDAAAALRDSVTM